MVADAKSKIHLSKHIKITEKIKKSKLNIHVYNKQKNGQNQCSQNHIKILTFFYVHPVMIKPKPPVPHLSAVMIQRASTQICVT